MRLTRLFLATLAFAACSAAGAAPALQDHTPRDTRAWPGNYPVQLVSVGVDTTHAAMLLPQASGWIGSDVGHSIPLDAGKSLWLFGDTLIGTVSGGKRQGGAAFINNSIGIQSIAGNPPGSMAFLWGPGTTAYFPHQPGTPGSYYWPSSGVMIGGKAFIFCFSVTGTPSGFSTVGTTLIRIDNPLDPPASWVRNYSDFGIGGDHIGFMTAMIVEGAHLYMMGFEDRSPGGRVAVLGRIATADLLAGGNASNMQFWVQGAGGPQWGSTATNLVALFSPGVTESDIQYVPEWGRYFTTSYEVFGPRIFLTTATSLTGPWATPVELYSVPDWNAYSFSIVAYAARPHPEFSTVPGEMVLSYATNTWGTLAPLFTAEGLNIYYPRFINARLSLTNSAVGDWTLY